MAQGLNELPPLDAGVDVSLPRAEIPSLDVTVEVDLPSQTNKLYEHVVGFGAGAAYGLTSVIVGQPLDTVKTRMQARPDLAKASMFRTARELAHSEGLRGLYRGGMPVFLGGTLFRSAQFGVYEVVLKHLQECTPSHKFFGFLNWQIAIAGVCGGVARGLIEAPFDKVKVTRQVGQNWTVRTLLDGSAITILRNSVLMCSFSIYRDIVPPLVPGGLGPFWLGATCSNLAWLTMWPLDVIKSQRQSGLYTGQSAIALLADAVRSGRLFRGVIPGIARSTVANGSAMVAYKKIEELAARPLPKWR